MCFKDSTLMDSLKHKCAESKGKSSSSSCKHELVDYHSLLSYQKENQFILNYYRSEWPLKQTILSIFSIHNETLNIWTHLIGFFIFLLLTICTGMMLDEDSREPIEFISSLTSPSYKYNIPSSSSWGSSRVLAYCSENNETDHACSMMFGKGNETDAKPSWPREQSIHRWPLYAFMCGAMFCLLTSSACHLLACHSKFYAYIMLRLDYTGISAHIVTSFYPLVYYFFMCHPFLRNLYIGAITVFGIAATLVSLLPVFQTPNFRMVRSGIFIVMAVSGFVPIVHKLMMFSHQTEAILTTGYEMMMGAFYVCGVVVYVARIPERWMPGKFDLAGHSHQLWHVLVIAGACTHYLGGLVCLKWREMEGCY